MTTKKIKNEKKKDYFQKTLLRESQSDQEKIFPKHFDRKFVFKIYN